MAKKKTAKPSTKTIAPIEIKIPMHGQVVDAKKIFEAAKTVDGFDNFVSRLGLNNDNTMSAGLYTFNLITRNRMQLEAAYRGSWLSGQIIDSRAEDMTRAGINITTNEGDDDIKDLRSKISKLKISQSLCSNTKWGDLYGGSIAVIQLRGQDLSTPLDISTVSKDQFLGLAVFDRWQLNPDLINIIKEGPDMGLPAYYNIITTASSVSGDAATPTGQIRVHHSRCIVSTGIQLPYFQAITESMWGESKLERLWDRLIAFDNATMSMAQLIDRANLRTVGIEGLREIIAMGGEAQAGLTAMFEMMRLMQVNEGITLLDKNDSFESTAYTFTGLSDVILQLAQQVSGAADIPLIRLLGQTPPGLNSNSEGDIRLYYDNINAEQEAELRDGWDKILRVMWRSTFGKDAPKDMEFTFVPLWQMSDLDKATLAKTKSETIIGAYDAGLVSQPASMKELRQMSGDTGMFSNITDEEIAQAELEPEDPPGFSELEPKAEPKDVTPKKELPAPPKKDNVETLDAFNEGDHPRKKDGKFGSGGGSYKEKSDKVDKVSGDIDATGARLEKATEQLLSLQKEQKHTTPEYKKASVEYKAAKAARARALKEGKLLVKAKDSKPLSNYEKIVAFLKEA
jgi:uncharacterized protein